MNDQPGDEPTTSPWASPDGDAGSSVGPPPAWPDARGGGAPPPPPPRRDDGGWSGGRRIPLRPMRYGEILDASFKLFRLTFVQVTLLVVITLGVFTALQAVVQPPQPGIFSDPAELGEPFSNADIVRLGISFLIGVLAQLFVLPIVRGAATGIAVEADRDGDTSWQHGLRTARELAGRLIGLSFLLLLLGLAVLLVFGLVAVLPIVLLVQAEVVAGAIVWGVLSALLALVLFFAGTALVYLAVPILLVERTGAWGAVRRSVELVRPQLLRVVGLVVVTVVLLTVVGAVLGVVQFPLAIVGGRVAQFGIAVTTLLAYVVTVPFEANIALLLYVDARVRHEGLDVAVLTAELDEL